MAYERTSRYLHICGLVAGTVLIWLFGISWLMYSLGMGLVPALFAGVLPFIIGDAIKAGAAYAIAERLP